MFEAVVLLFDYATYQIISVIIPFKRKQNKEKVTRTSNLNEV